MSRVHVSRVMMLHSSVPLSFSLLFSGDSLGDGGGEAGPNQISHKPGPLAPVGTSGWTLEGGGLAPDSQRDLGHLAWVFSSAVSGTTH